MVNDDALYPGVSSYKGMLCNILNFAAVHCVSFHCLKMDPVLQKVSPLMACCVYKETTLDKLFKRSDPSPTVVMVLKIVEIVLTLFAMAERSM